MLVYNHRRFKVRLPEIFNNQHRQCEFEGNKELLEDKLEQTQVKVTKLKTAKRNVLGPKRSRW